MHVSESDLELYLLGRLEEREATAIQSHVAGCSVCGARLTATEKFVDQLADLSRRQAVHAGDPGAEKRKEPRFATNDRAWLKILRPLSGVRLGARVLDVSKEGLKLSLAQRLDPGMAIEIRVGKMIAFGEVRYCAEVGEEFHAGVQLNDVWLKDKLESA